MFRIYHARFSDVFRPFVAKCHRRRRATAAQSNRLFCGTNGCASFLDLDPETGTATCHICGFVRRVN